jgi:hypothetical protein
MEPLPYYMVHGDFSLDVQVHMQDRLPFLSSLVDEAQLLALSLCQHTQNRPCVCKTDT